MCRFTGKNSYWVELDSYFTFTDVRLYPKIDMGDAGLSSYIWTALQFGVSTEHIFINL